MAHTRCFGTGDALYEHYHDDEWGHPPERHADERELLERLALEGFQSGLSWITVLRKRPAFREAFDEFAPQMVSAYGDDDVARLLSDERIIRNEPKIRAVIRNARALISLHEEGRLLWDVLEAHAPQQHEPPATVDRPHGRSPESAALAKELKQLGFTFVGPVTMYALMQAVGVIDDHADDCWLGRGSR